MKQKTTRTVAVWDLPTRLFHWGLAASFAVAWLTAESDRSLAAHVFAGYLMLGLLAFRLVWGLVGGRYARFRDFAYGWRAVRGYLIDLLRGRARRYLGHNPAGAWAVFGLIALGCTVPLTGLMLLGAQEGQGPLAGWLGFPLAEGIEELHEAVASAMLALVLVHIAGVFVESLVHRENLVHAMLTGYKRQEGTAPGSAMYRTVAVALIATGAAAATVYFSGSPGAMPGNAGSYSSSALLDNETWRSECGSCHLAYHPSLLPTRSWERLLDQEAKHFGEDLSLDGDVLVELSTFAVRNAAESRLTEAAWKIGRSIPAHDSPLRITDTPYWARKHREIPETVWRRPDVKSKVNCDACHQDAEQGTFEDGAIRPPKAAMRD